MLDISDIAAVDNHCHLPLDEPPPRLQAAGLARFFTEASIPEVLENQTPHSLFFRRAVRDLAAVLGFSDGEIEDGEGNLQTEAILAKRAEYAADDWFRLMLEKANLDALFRGYGLPSQRWLECRKGSIGGQFDGKAAGCALNPAYRASL